jgi:hypothetical protein
MLRPRDLARPLSLALLGYCAWTLTDTTRRLRVLHELAAHPHSHPDNFEWQVLGKINMRNTMVPTRPMTAQEENRQRLQERFTEPTKDDQYWADRVAENKHGGPHQGPSAPSSASQAATTEPSAPTGSTEERGRWTPTFGTPMEGSITRHDPISPAPTSRTSLPTAAGLPVVGAPGQSADAVECECRDSNREGPIKPPGEDKYDPRGLHYTYCPLYERAWRPCCNTVTGTDHLAECPVNTNRADEPAISMCDPGKHSLASDDPESPAWCLTCGASKQQIVAQ